MAKKAKDYFGLPYWVSVICVILFPIALIFGVITRLKEGKIVAGILRLFLGWNILWILDIIFMLFKKQIFRLLNC